MKIDSYVKFMFHPYQYDTLPEKVLGFVGSIAIGILTLGLLHLASAIVLRDKVFCILKKGEDATADTVSQVAARAFLKTISPANIETALEVSSDRDTRPKPNFLQIVREDYHSLRTGNSSHGYGFYFQKANGGEIFNANALIIDEKFAFRTGSVVGKEKFDNLDDCVRYLFRSEHFEGKKQGFVSDVYIIKKKDGTEIQYENPFTR
jgi:hypothetical protein